MPQKTRPVLSFLAAAALAISVPATAVPQQNGQGKSLPQPRAGLSLPALVAFIERAGYHDIRQVRHRQGEIIIVAETTDDEKVILTYQPSNGRLRRSAEGS